MIYMLLWLMLQGETYMNRRRSIIFIILLTLSIAGCSDRCSVKQNQKTRSYNENPFTDDEDSIIICSYILDSGSKYVHREFRGILRPDLAISKGYGLYFLDFTGGSGHKSLLYPLLRDKDGIYLYRFYDQLDSLTVVSYNKRNSEKLSEEKLKRISEGFMNGPSYAPLPPEEK